MRELDVFRKLANIEITTSVIPVNLLHSAYQYAYQKENLHSQLLVDCLNCDKNNQSGILQAFLLEFGADKETVQEICLESLRLTTERNICGRRIDIFIEWKNAKGQKCAIIIENKLNGASDQKNQLNDYFTGITKEGYVVISVVYLCFTKHEPSYKITFKEPKLKILDIQSLITSIKNQIESQFLGCENPKSLSKETARIFSASYHYYEFLECLKSNNLMKMKALEIINVCSLEDINKLQSLLTIVQSNEWCEARFQPLSEKLKTEFGEKLEINYKRHSDGRCYAEYFFQPYDKWIELWLEEDDIKLWIVSKTDNDFIDLLDVKYKKWGKEVYYYYTTDLEFEYPIDNPKIISTITPMLEELSKKK